jgi:hypothetical protein
VYYSADAFANSNKLYIGDGPAKVHDHCQCTMRPVFSKADKYDERAKYFLDQWKQFGRGATVDGKRVSAENNFRRNYVPPPPYSTEGLDLSERRKVISDVQKNRERLIARGFAADSPNVKFLDDSIKELSKA